MGGVGRAIKKFVNGVVKLWKKLDPITFKILEKLGLRGKHITHTYLMVQPLHSGYMPDPVKTYVAQAIAMDADIPTYLQDALQQGAGINLMRYYHFCRIRIKKYNFKSSTSVIAGGSPITKAELKQIVEQFIPSASTYPYLISDMSITPVPLGAYWAYVDKYKLRLENLRLRAGVSGLDPNKHKGIAEDLYETDITIGSEKIHVLKTGEIFWEENGTTISKPMYVGAKDLPSFVQDDKFFYFYDENVTEAFGKSYAYMLLLVPRVVDSTLDSETFISYSGTDPDGILSEEITIIDDTSSILVYRKHTREIQTNSATGARRIRSYTQTFRADTNNLENLEVLYGNTSAESHTGFFAKFQELATNDDTTADEVSYFKFFPAIPIKRRDKHTLTFKDGDPYAGTYDPAKHEAQLKDEADKVAKLAVGSDNPNADAIVAAYRERANVVSEKNAANNDSEVQRPPRNRSTTPKGYTKPRKVSQRLRRKVKSGVTPAEYRKFVYAAKLLGEEYEALVGQLIHSEQENDSPEVHHSYILPSVTLNSKVQEVRQYWFKFFERVYLKLHNNQPATVNVTLNPEFIDNIGKSWFNSMFPNGYAGDAEFEATLAQPRKYNMIKPNQISISAVTDSNQTDTLLFNISYVAMTKFKTVGKLKPTKKRRLRNYYDIKMGDTATGWHNLIMPIKVIKQGKNVIGVATGSGYYQPPNGNNFRFLTEKLPSPAQGFQELNDSDFEDTLSDPDIKAWTCFCKQVGDNEIEVIAVQGLQLTSIVHDKGTTMSAHEYLLNYSELEGQGYYNMFTIPICYNTLRASGLVNNTKFAARTVQRLDYSTKDEYKPWYARSAFKVVLTIVQIVLFIVTIWSGGWGASLAEIAKQGAMAVVKEVLVRLAISIAINLAIQAVVKALGKLFGAEFAAILGAIASIVMMAYGISDASGITLPYASQVFMIAPAIISGSMASLSNMQANVQSMIEKEKAAYEKATKNLEEGKEYFEAYVNSEIDPQAFVSALNTRIEMMDEFITRTLETNMNQFADLDFLSDSLDNSLVMNYMPDREMNWSGVPTDSSVPADWEDNLPQELRG